MKVLCSLPCAAILVSLVSGCASADAPTAPNAADATTTNPTTAKPATTNTANPKEVPAVLNFTMKSLAGKDVDLSQYAGKVIMIVNTASKCGFTKQYKALQQLHEKYGEQGLAILGFPANDFGSQEPGTEAEIEEFCQKNYGVKFDMFSKVQVKGDGKAPLFEYLTSAQTNPQFSGEVGWNFEKFLIDREGKIVARYKSQVAPDADELVKAVEAELAK